METIRNQVVIVHAYCKEDAIKLREDAIIYFQDVLNRMKLKYGYQAFDSEMMITPVLESFINQEYTFFINGDCSKIGSGWPESDEFKAARLKWIEENKHNVTNIVLVDFGEDYPAKILFDSTLEIRDEE